MPGYSGGNAVLHELQIPYSHVRRNSVLLVVVYAFVIGSAGLAVFNLSHLESTPWGALIASTIWLCGVTALIALSYIEYGGLRNYLRNHAAYFVKYHFAQFRRSTGDVPDLCFGYRLFGRRFEYFQVELRGIASVSWSQGQASDMSGQDCDDWNVFIWYDASVAAQSGQSYVNTSTGEGVYLVTETGSKEQIAGFGRTFITFLQQGGIEFGPPEEVKRCVTYPTCAQAKAGQL